MVLTFATAGPYLLHLQGNYALAPLQNIQATSLVNVATKPTIISKSKYSLKIKFESFESANPPEKLCTFLKCSSPIQCQLSHCGFRFRIIFIRLTHFHERKWQCLKKLVTSLNSKPQAESLRLDSVKESSLYILLIFKSIT